MNCDEISLELRSWQKKWERCYFRLIICFMAVGIALWQADVWLLESKNNPFSLRSMAFFAFFVFAFCTWNFVAAKIAYKKFPRPE